MVGGGGDRTTWVDKTKVRGENGGLTVSDPREGEYTEWTGQKVYDEDSVVLWKENDEVNS